MITVSNSHPPDVSAWSRKPVYRPPGASPVQGENTRESPGKAPTDRNQASSGLGRSGDKLHETYAPAARRAPDGHELSMEEIQRVLELEERDKEVRAHEQAHMAAGGQYVRGGASFKYETGPDGKKYAVAGEVTIDTSEEKDPEATIRKMETVRRAALAPAHPSSKDRAVAAEAGQKAQRAAEKLARMQRQAQEEHSGPGAEGPRGPGFKNSTGTGGNPGTGKAHAPGGSFSAYG